MNRSDHEIPLSIPVTLRQIDAACRLRQRLTDWQLADATLARLGENVPGFDPAACLLKSVAVNTLYGIQVLAIVRMAEHVYKSIVKHSTATDGTVVVKEIAAFAANGDGKPRKFVSFAAKFSHFFIDEEQFPIYDEAARDALKLHLGAANLAEDKSDPYQAFCTNLKRLRDTAKFRGSGRNLDQYLWITGMYMKWLKIRAKPNPQMNVELRSLFEKPGNAATDLDILPPSILKGSL